MNQISNRALISRLYVSAENQLQEASFDIESWTEWYNVVQGFDVPEKMVYLIVKLNQTVTNGGFTEFYESSFGVFAPEIIHVLSEIKASSAAKIVDNTMLVVNPNGLLDNEYKASVFNLKVTDQQKTQLFNQDLQYDQLEGHENLEDLLGDYLQVMYK